MTSREIAVLLEGVRAGTITETNGRLRLRYDDGYRQPDATPLSVSMPVQVTDHGHEPTVPVVLGRYNGGQTWRVRHLEERRERR